MATTKRGSNELYKILVKIPKFNKQKALSLSRKTCKHGHSLLSHPQCLKTYLEIGDERVGFLDIEQRLHFVHLIRSVIGNSDTKSAFVVDHDIVLIDLISDRLMIFEGESSAHGKASAPLKKRQGMNQFLKDMNITMRRDKDTLRPRINKPDSNLDREQKEKGEYYYSF